LKPTFTLPGKRRHRNVANRSAKRGEHEERTLTHPKKERQMVKSALPEGERT
jgi:hypothetical protein